MKKYKSDYLYIIATIFVIILAFILRYILMSVATLDYKMFLRYWFEFIDANGIKGLGFYPFDYAPLYFTLLTLGAYLTIKHLYMVKFLSITFEVLYAILLYFFMRCINKNESKYKQTFLSTIILLLPTVITNSCYWCQCDIIYTFFVFLSLYLYCNNRVDLSFISLGLAFSFKLQFIFILPVYIILYFKNKNIKIYHFAYIPIINLVCSIPAFIMGFSLRDLANIYITQTSEYNDYITLNIDNIYRLFDFKKIFHQYTIYVMIIFTIILFILLLIYCIKKVKKFNTEKILQLSILSILICLLFLPCMHERYLFMGDLLSISYFLMYRKGLIQAILINCISFYGYSHFIFHYYGIPEKLVAVVFVLVTINQFLIFSKSKVKG